MGDADQFDGDVGGDTHAGALGERDGDLVQVLVESSVAAPGHGLGGDGADGDHHAEAARQGGDEEVQPLEGRGVPKRVHLARCVGEERAQGALVQGGEDDARDGKPQGDPPDAALAGGETDPLEEGRGDLEDLHREIGGDVPGDQEEHRRRPEGNHHRVGEAPGLPRSARR